MDYSDIRLLSLLKVKMAYHAENQDHLARNIANADTPGFQPSELRELDFERLAMIESRKLHMRATSAFHMEPKESVGQFREEKDRETFETTPVKNRVALDEQMAKVAYNNHEYMLATNLYRKTTNLFRIAVTGNR